MKRSFFKPKPRKLLKRSPFKRRKPIIATYLPQGAKIKGKIDLHRKAWDLFSRWVRNRDKMCVTCGDRGNLQAGHFWHACLDFDEMNINAQCKKCNHFMSGNLAPYSIYLIRKHGQEAFEDLEKRHWIAMKGEFRTEQDYLNIIEKYKALVIKSTHS